MAYRLKIAIEDRKALDGLKDAARYMDQIVAPYMKDALDLIAEQARQNLSGVPFGSGEVIQKRTGKGVASVQTQYPYRSQYNGRVYASAMTRYANNPEEYNYLAILEYGRGPIRPKYTPSMLAGNPGKARLAIPGGPFMLANGSNGFRGVSGRYRFVREIPAMEGKYWMRSALESVAPQLRQLAYEKVDEYLEAKGF